jgi:hypothetical protein
LEKLKHSKSFFISAEKTPKLFILTIFHRNVKEKFIFSPSFLTPLSTFQFSSAE